MSEPRNHLCSKTNSAFPTLQHPLSRTEDAPTALDETVDKMDAMMYLTFEHLQRQARAGRLDETFETLLNSFQTTILHTYRSKFTQVGAVWGPSHPNMRCCISSENSTECLDGLKYVLLDQEGLKYVLLDQ